MLGVPNQNYYSVKDVPAKDFISAYAEHLKKNDQIKLPKWFNFVKTGKGKELSPQDEDWLYVRAASLARKIYLRGNIGVGTFKHIYGGKQSFGVTKPHHTHASGKVIRYCLQQLEAINVIKKDKKNEMKKNSRVISPVGQQTLNNIANEVAKKIHNL